MMHHILVTKLTILAIKFTLLKRYDLMCYFMKIAWSYLLSILSIYWLFSVSATFMLPDIGTNHKKKLNKNVYTKTKRYILLENFKNAYLNSLCPIKDFTDLICWKWEDISVARTMSITSVLNSLKTEIDKGL